MVSSSTPNFPESERARGTRSAVVRLELTISPSGNVEQVKVVESAGADFDDAAKNAARNTVFAPAKVRSLQAYAISFELR